MPIDMSAQYRLKKESHVSMQHADIYALMLNHSLQGLWKLQHLPSTGCC